MQHIKQLTRLVILGSIFTSGAANAAAPLSDVAQTLLTGGHILTKLMWAACIVVGIALIAAAFTQFQIHRRNPKLVPLTTPVMYLILGIAAISIPFIEHATGFLESKLAKTGGISMSSAKETPIDIDAPYD